MNAIWNNIPINIFLFNDLNESNKTTEIVITRPGKQGQGTRGPCPHNFVRSKKKRGKQREKKERVTKQKLLKGCHQGQNATVLAILEHLEFKNFAALIGTSESKINCSIVIKGGGIVC